MRENHRTRLARCGCGALSAETRGEPMHVYLCTCRKCQIQTGTAFSYGAVFPEKDVTISGVHHAWRHTGDTGGWVENHFCPVCGTKVFFSALGFPGALGVSVGCFAEEEGTARDAALTPQCVYWAESKRDWVRGPEGVE